MVGQGVIPIVHDQSFVLSDLHLTTEYGAAENFGINVVVPLRVVRTGIEYFDTSGNEVELTNPGIHHRDQVLSGIGDPLLTARTVRPVGPFLIGAKIGAALPLGRTEENPFRLGELGLRHEHLQFGTGTLRPLFGFESAYRADAWSLQLSGQTEQGIYENDKGYLPGDRYSLTLLGASSFGSSKWTFLAGARLQVEQPDLWDGEIPSEGNRGRTDVLGIVSATWRSNDYFIAPTIQVPIATRVVGGQLSYPLIASVGVGRSFGRPPAHDHDEHEHEHEHEHGDHEATADDLTMTGEAVELVPVTGKITVFDFWAEWCRPCYELDALLRELAQTHPELAIRRINIVDWDSPASEKYLVPKSYDLPHLKVYGADGKLLWERSGGAKKLAADVEAHLGDHDE